MEIKYRVIFSRRRTISLIVNPVSGVTVRAPYRTSMRTIEALVSKKSAWISKHLENKNNNIRLNPGGVIKHGDTMLFMGMDIPVQISSGERNTLKFNGEQFEVTLNANADPELLNGMFRTWYRKVAGSKLTIRFGELLEKYSAYGFRPSGLKIRSLKSRWGSCSRNGSITLNSELIKLDEIYIDHVIVHELCHLMHHNHGNGFHSLMHEIDPGYLVKRRELKKFITR